MLINQPIEFEVTICIVNIIYNLCIVVGTRFFPEIGSSHPNPEIEHRAKKGNEFLAIM